MTILRFVLRFLLISSAVVIVLFAIIVAVLAAKQDEVVQQLLANSNENFRGEIEIQGSHISPFVNFPYVSIDLDHVKLFEDKSKAGEPLVDVADVYIGFDLFKLMGGEMQLKAIKITDGSLHVVQHSDGMLNILNALSSADTVSNATQGQSSNIDIRSIQLERVDITKLNEANQVLVEAFIREARSKFKSVNNHIQAKLHSNFELNVLLSGDTTFVKHKDFDVYTALDFNQESGLLTIEPSEFKLENSFFRVDGTVQLNDDMNLNINFHGNKPNFDVFLAFAPEELAPVLSRYDNAGKIFFEASVKGKSINGHLPVVVAEFGCEDAFFSNKVSKKKVDQLFFKGRFTTGEQGSASTSVFELQDFSARPETGAFKGKLRVKNFSSPDIDMQLQSQFQLDFLADFLGIQNIQDLKGSVTLTMNFHDIVDLDRPERTIEKLNQSYFTQLEVKDLSFSTPRFHLPVNDLDIKASMTGNEANIEQFNIRVGNSDVSLKAVISDLPAIIHHTSDPVTAALDVKSSVLDVKQLTSFDTIKSKPVDERITDMSMKFKFKSSARAFTESPNLPIGEFFIDNLYAKPNHYPHKLHDFHADVYVDSLDFRVIDFTGMIDDSDFHFNGRLRNYDMWFLEEPLGDTKIEFNLRSTLLKLENLFAYGGENYVPQDYRHEEFRNLLVHGVADLHFNKGLKSADVNFDRVEAAMKVHPMRFEQFKGRFHYENDHLVVENFGGKLGKSDFTAKLHYYLGTDTLARKRENFFSLRAPRLDFDELFSYQPPAQPVTPAEHEAAFNIYDVPFSHMRFEFDIKQLNYHRYLINDFYAKARTTPPHFIFVDTLSMGAAGGKIGLKGYFNGSDRNKIYFNPEMSFQNVDLDKLLFKFENFGQDHLVSENLHGQLSGKLTGKVHVHADMVPIIDDSEIHLDVRVVNGRLERYSALQAMGDFFKDKNLNRVRFDTLQNKFDIVKGVLNIPAMTINSSIGFIEISGKQDVNLNMEYYVRVPLQLVTQVARQKLFGGKDELATPDEDDEIQYRDQNKKYRFVNIKITGTPESYNISLGKKKK